MIIRKSTLADTNRVTAIYELAKKGMRDMGLDQWQDGYPNAESFKSDIENDISIVVEDDNGIVIGTAAAYVGHESTYDKIYDGEWLSDLTEYGMIHRIAVDPQSRNTGIASMIMSYVSDLCRKANISYSRCDTHKDNVIMRHTLEKNGYKYCGIILLKNGDQRVAYELPLDAV